VVDGSLAGEIAHSEILDAELKNASVIVDFDSDDRLLGIEILGARRLLRSEVLEQSVPYPSERGDE
jgi:uncharacterized protein YuzE